MRAVNDAVVIETIQDTHDVGGLDLRADGNQIRYNYGLVITASPNTVLKEGDKVYYDSVAGSKLRIEGKQYLVLRERDIALIDD